jgi:surface protein
MNSKLNQIKSPYNLKEIFTFVKEKTKLKIIKYNKYLQNKIGVTLEDYETLNNIVVNIKFTPEYINKLKEEYNEIKKKIEKKEYDGEQKKKELENDLYLKGQELKCRFMGAPFFNQNKEFIKVYLDDVPVENPRFFIDFLKEQTIPNIIKVTIDKKSNVKDFFCMFAKCRAINELTFKRINTKEITSMNYMFYDCINLKSLDLSEFETNELTNMFGMFKNCQKLENIKLSDNFITPKVTNMQYLFEDCWALLSIDVHKFDTSKLDCTVYMFKNCKNLVNLDVSNFNTDNVYETHAMFEGCEKLANLNLPPFKTDKLKSITNLFYKCKNLFNIDLSNFNFEKLEETENCLTDCPAMVKLKKNSKLATLIPSDKIIYVD